MQKHNNKKITNKDRKQIALELIEHFTELLCNHDIQNVDDTIANLYSIAHTGLQKCQACAKEFDEKWIPVYRDLQKQKEAFP